MRGFPKKIATKQDVENLAANPKYATQVKAHIQTLLDERYGWVVTGKLADAKSGTIKEGFKIVEVVDEISKAVKYYQAEWKTEPGCGLNRLGLTVADAEKIVGLKSNA
jgi:hypothetical protein